MNNVFSKKDSFARDSFYVTLSKVIALGIQLVSIILLSRFRTLDEYGTYSQLILVVNLFLSLFSLGLPNSISFFLGKKGSEEHKDKFLSSFFTLSIFLSLFSGIVLSSLSYPISLYFKNDAIRKCWFFLLAFPCASLLNSSVENLAVSIKKSKILIPFRLLHSFLMLSAVLLCYVLNISFLLYLVFYLSIEIIFAFVVFVIAYRDCKTIRLSFNKNIVKSILAFSIPIGIATAIGTINSEIDKFMIGYFMTTSDVAIYTNASKELPFTIISAAFTSALLPRMAKFLSSNESDKAFILWRKSIVISFAILSLFSFGCFCFSKDIIELLYGEKYASGDGVFKVFSILLLFRSTYWGLVLNTSGKTKFILYSSIFSLLLNAILNFLFFRLFGMVGCAISTLLSTFVVSIVQLVYTSRLYKVKLSKIIPIQKILIILATNIVLALFFTKTKILVSLDSYIGSFFESLILGCCWGGIYLLILIVLKPLLFEENKDENIDSL